MSFAWSFDPLAKSLISQLCQKKFTKRLCTPENIVEHKYFSLPNSIEKTLHYNNKSNSSNSEDFNGSDQASAKDGWEMIENRCLVPPYIPRLKNEKEGDLKYFKDSYLEEIDNKSLLLSDGVVVNGSTKKLSQQSTPFEGF